MDSLERPQERNTRLAVGGPDVLSYRDIAVLAAGAAGVQKPRCAMPVAHALPRIVQVCNCEMGRPFGLQSHNGGPAAPVVLF